ncbi:unnamed protein product [Auanema sp. JU1783]|nr:unnamed protein product [Auanema sp. JU1783]
MYYPFAFLIFLNSFTTKSSWNLNFRISVQMINLGNFVMNFQQTISIIIRLVVVGNDPRLLTAFSILRYSQNFGNILEVFSWLFLIIERLVATVLVSQYERFTREMNYSISIIASGMIFIFAICYVIMDNTGLEFLILQAVLIVAEIVILIILIQSNKKRHENRHLHQLNLSDRFQIQENISATSYILPMFVTKLIHISVRTGLLVYSVFFTDIPLGYDTGYITHAYNISIAVYRAIFGIYLVYANPDYNKSKQRNVVDVGNATQTTKNYFQSLNEMWR